MTVKCLSEAAKQNIAAGFSLHIYTINQLANMYVRSRRTIIRVLEEKGIDPGVKHRVKKPIKEEQFVFDTAVVRRSSDQEVLAVIMHPEPMPKPSWFRRVMAWFSQKDVVTQ
jgi:hypothetical protein